MQCVELPAGRPVLPGILISVLAAGNQPVAAVIPRGRNLINLGGRQELGQTHPAATNIIGAILGRRPNFWGKSFTFFLKQKITKIANFSGCWGSAPDPAQHPKLRAAGAGRDGSLVGGDAGRARAPNPARIGATGRYPHLSSPRHLSTPHLPSPLLHPSLLSRQYSREPKEMAVGARAERLRGSTKTITAPRHHCALHRPLPQPHQATRFPHARLIAPAVCAASDSGSPDALNVGGAHRRSPGGTPRARPISARPCPWPSATAPPWASWRALRAVAAAPGRWQLPHLLPRPPPRGSDARAL